MDENEGRPLLYHFPRRASSLVGYGWHSTARQGSRLRQSARKLMSSRIKHYLILSLVILDVAGILADIFIGLLTCELDRENEPWVKPTRNGLTTFSLVMSCLFMAELLISVLAEGWRYFTQIFHCFDAFVIVVSFAIDIVEHGTVVEEIASLIVVLRLWRVIKLVEEFSVEAEEQAESLRVRIKDLEKQNSQLEAQIGRARNSNYSPWGGKGARGQDRRC